MIHYPLQDFEEDIAMPLCRMHPSLLLNRTPWREIPLHAQRMKSFLSGLMQLVWKRRKASFWMAWRARSARALRKCTDSSQLSRCLHHRRAKE